MTVEKKICWRVTRACNLYCRHCLAGNKNELIKDLDYNSQLQLLNTVYKTGITRITWTGGEPTLLPQISGLLQQSREYGISNLITTHGLSLKQVFLESLIPTLDTIRISFDGLEKTHNMIRGGKYFSKSISAIEKVKKYGINVEANITVTKINQLEIPSLIELLKQSGISKVVLLSLMGRESALFNEIMPLDNRERKPLDVFISHLIETSFGIQCQYNNYDVSNDWYIVIESDGNILLTSENSADRSFGYAHTQNATDRLMFALNRQNHFHRVKPTINSRSICYPKA